MFKKPYLFLAFILVIVQMSFAARILSLRVLGGPDGKNYVVLLTTNSPGTSISSALANHVHNAYYIEIDGTPTSDYLYAMLLDIKETDDNSWVAMVDDQHSFLGSDPIVRINGRDCQKLTGVGYGDPYIY